MSNDMYTAGDHENSALSVIRDNPQMAQAFAILALASAVNRLASAQEALAADR